MIVFAFILGVKVKDIVTDFTGIVTARVEYLNGCIVYSVRPPVDKDGKLVDSVYFDEDRLRFVDNGVVATMTSSSISKTVVGHDANDNRATEPDFS